MIKDIIKVTLKDGSKKDMEIVMFYMDEKKGQNYILYKELDNNDECYAAKYVMEKNNNYKLDTNLTKFELANLSALLNATIKGGN